jgi:GTP cyclohydrolase I
MDAPEDYIKSVFLQLWGRRFDWSSEHMQKTPERFVKMLQELTTPEEVDFTTFASSSDEMVVLQNISFHSLCAHHIVPFMGVCHVAYIPNGRIVGLSKIPRVVKHYAADLTVQEELTTAIAEHLDLHLQPLGVAVVMRAEHLCATIRGVQSPGMLTTTSKMTGVFLDPAKGAREEFLALVR